jgi:hypothetical protein
MNRRIKITGLLVALLLLPAAIVCARGGGGGRGGFGGGFGGGGGFHGYGGGGFAGGGGYRGGYGGGGFGGYGGGYRGGNFGGDFRPASHPDFGSAGNFGGHDAFSRSDFGRSIINNPYDRGGVGRGDLNFNSRPTEQRLDSFLGLPHAGGEDRMGGLGNAGDRGPIDISRTNVANSAAHGMHDRPAWQNLNREQIGGLNNKVSNAIGRDGKGRQDMHNWMKNHPNRAEHWNNWAHNVRNHWDHHDWDHGNWWRHHYPYGPWWNYWGVMGLMPWGYWWNVPTWGGIGEYCGDMGEPIYYDYGEGGNVYCDDENNVYVNGQDVGSLADYTKSLADLATVAPPADSAANDAAQWLPLGNFSVSTSQKDTDPTRVMQLAVNKEGIISGMLYNQTTDKSLPIQGRVDKATQRVAFRIGNNDHVVCETGIYDLTKDQAPLLVHFGADKTEQYLLVRLDKPKSYGDEELPVPSTDSNDGTNDGTPF